MFRPQNQSEITALAVCAGLLKTNIEIVTLYVYFEVILLIVHSHPFLLPSDGVHFDCGRKYFALRDSKGTNGRYH